MSGDDIDARWAPRLARDLDGAFPGFVDEVADDLHRGLLRLVGDRSDAEDLGQEVLLRAYRGLAAMDPARRRSLRLRGWLWTIALNRCRTRATRRASRPEVVRLDPAWVAARADGGPGPAELAVEVGAWTARLAELSEAQRRAVVLRHVVGLPYEEVAVALERPVGTVKADVHRGLARLRAVLADEDGREPSPRSEEADAWT